MTLSRRRFGVASLAGLATVSGDQRGAVGNWSVLPASPLTARRRCISAWTGKKALFLGGTTAPPCNTYRKYCGDDDADVELDGAAYLPASRRWERIADAPVPLPMATGLSAVTDDRLYVLAEDGLLAYDWTADRWSGHASPPGHPAQTMPGYSLLACQGQVVGLAPGDVGAPRLPDSVYAPGATGGGGQWSTLPEDPLGPADFRIGLGTPEGLLLTASDVEGPAALGPAPLMRAALLDLRTMTWRRLADTDQLQGWNWTWTGARAVSATPGTDSGSNSSYGRPMSRCGAFSMPAGKWSALPTPPNINHRSLRWAVEASRGPLVASGGWLYDDRTRRWTMLASPGKDLDTSQPGSAVWTDTELIVLGDAAAAPVNQSRTLSGTVRSYHV